MRIYALLNLIIGSMPRPRGWREWFVRSEETPAYHDESTQVEVVSGAGHKDYDKLELKKKLPPRCASCKQFMGHNSGMHILISTDWRVHIHCFTKVLERHFENGEVIDLTTGNISAVDSEDTNS